MRHDRETKIPDIEDLHETACLQNKTFYTDPTTNLLVFTADHLKTRPCCGCGCRHCPYRPPQKPHFRAKLLSGAMDDLPSELDVLFWSGGKDSYLALRRLKREAMRPVLLLTTYDGATGMVAHQEVGIETVVRQAKWMRLPLLGVPVVYGEYVQSVRDGLERVRDHGVDVVRVAFGDLHLRHIREWREGQLGGLGAELVYPVWDVEYERLMDELEGEGVVVRVSAVDVGKVGECVRVGDLFGRELVARLPDGVDRFGENGEFHTMVEVWEGRVRG